MTLSGYGKWAEPVSNSSSSPCGYNMTNWEHTIETMYTYFYLLVFIPGLVLNTTALWVLCRHIRYSQEHQNQFTKVPLGMAHPAASLSPVRTPKR